MSKTLQLLRNQTVYTAKNEALTALQEYLADNAKDGEMMLARYQDGTSIKTLIGVCAKDIEGEQTVKYTIFDADAIPSEVQQAIDDLIGAPEHETPDEAYDTIYEISKALTVINGSGEGSIAKAEADAKAYADEKVAALDYADTAVAGSYVDSVSETDGKIAVTRKPITSADSSITLNTANGVDMKVNIDGVTIIRDGESGKLSVASLALMQYVGVNAIAVGEVNPEENTKTISLILSPNEKVLTQDSAGLLTNISIKKLENATEGFASSYQLVGIDGATPLGDVINIAKDMVVSAAEVKEVETADKPYVGALVGDKYIDFTIANATNDHIYLAAKDMFDTYVQGNGIEITGNKIAINIDGTSESFLTVGAGGLKLAGVQDAIDAASGALQTAIDKVEASVGLAANGSHAAATGNYTSTATTVVGEIAALDTNLATVSGKVDSAQTELDKVEASIGLGENGSFTADTTANYVSGATSVMDAISKLDDQAKANADAIAQAQQNAISVKAGNGINITSGGDNGTEKTITAVAKPTDPIIEVTAGGIGTKEEAVFDMGYFDAE